MFQNQSICNNLNCFQELFVGAYPQYSGPYRIKGQVFPHLHQCVPQHGVWRGMSPAIQYLAGPAEQSNRILFLPWGVQLFLDATAFNFMVLTFLTRYASHYCSVFLNECHLGKRWCVKSDSLILCEDLRRFPWVTSRDCDDWRVEFSIFHVKRHHIDAKPLRGTVGDIVYYNCTWGKICIVPTLAFPRGQYRLFDARYIVTSLAQFLGHKAAAWSHERDGIMTCQWSLAVGTQHGHVIWRDSIGLTIYKFSAMSFCRKQKISGQEFLFSVLWRLSGTIRLYYIPVLRQCGEDKLLSSSLRTLFLPFIPCSSSFPGKFCLLCVPFLRVWRGGSSCLYKLSEAAFSSIGTSLCEPEHNMIESMIEKGRPDVGKWLCKGFKSCSRSAAMTPAEAKCEHGGQSVAGALQYRMSIVAFLFNLSNKLNVRFPLS